MKAKKIFESLKFERSGDPKKSMKIGSGRFIVDPDDIEFSMGKGQGFIEEPLIIFKAKGYTRPLGKKLIGSVTGSVIDNEMIETLLESMIPLLNSPEFKLKCAEELQKIYERDPSWFKIKK